MGRREYLESFYKERNGEPVIRFVPVGMTEAQMLSEIYYLKHLEVVEFCAHYEDELRNWQERMPNKDLARAKKILDAVYKQSVRVHVRSAAYIEHKEREKHDQKLP